MTRSCPNCSSLIPADAARCDYCGEEVLGAVRARDQSPGTPDPETKICPECAEEIKYAAKVCRYCGFRFGSAHAPEPPLAARAPGEGLMRAGRALDNAGKALNGIVGSIILIVVIIFLFNVCTGDGPSGQSARLPAGKPGDKGWVNGWTCDGLRETFIDGDPAADPLHDWTRADVAVAEAAYANRC